MSLVILRSWADGPPPKIKGIATDEKEDEYIPDHKGRFVTSDGPKIAQNGINTIQEDELDGEKGLKEDKNKKKVLIEKKIELTTPPRPDHLSDGNSVVKPDLIRSSSSPDSENHSDYTPPMSPGGNNGSRYKKLTPELAATIPKRQLKNFNWMRKNEGWRRSDSSPCLVDPWNMEERFEEREDKVVLVEMIKKEPNSSYTQSLPRKVSFKVPSSQSGVEDELTIPVNKYPTSSLPRQTKFQNMISAYNAEATKSLSHSKDSPITIGLVKNNENEISIKPQPLSPITINTSSLKRNEKKKFESDESLLNNAKNSQATYGRSNKPEPITTKDEKILPMKKKSNGYNYNENEKSDFYNMYYNYTNNANDEYMNPNDKEIIISEEDLIPIPRDITIIPDLKVVPPKDDSSSDDFPLDEFNGMPERKEEINEVKMRNGNSNISVLNLRIGDFPLPPPPALDSLSDVTSEDEVDLSNEDFLPPPNQAVFKVQSQNQNLKSSYNIYEPLEMVERNPSSMQTNVRPSASARVPVQCVNRLVFTHELPQHKLQDWNRNSMRESFRGFCRDLLDEKDDKGDDNDGIINFDDDTSDLSSTLEMDNSIEYISVGNVQVGGNDKSIGIEFESDNLVIIALDFGSKKCGYACHINGHTFVADPIESIFLLDSEGSFQVGSKALQVFFSEKEAKKTRSLVIKWRELIADEATFPYSFESLDFEPKNLMKLMVAYFGKKAIQYLESHFGHIHSRKEVRWIVNVPGQWNGSERKAIREAAWESGLLRSSDTLALITDSLAAFHTIEKNMNDGVILSVDFGSSFVHFGVYEYDVGIQEKWEMITSSSELIKNTPDQAFESLLEEVFTREFILNYRSKWKPGWINLMRNWDEAKFSFDPDFDAPNFIFLPGNFAKEFLKFTNIEIGESLVEGMRYDENGALVLSKEKMSSLFTPALNFILGRIEKLERENAFDKIFLTGGYSRSKFMTNKIHEIYPIRKVSVDPELTVVHGSIMSKIHLKSTLAIKSPFSLGIGVMTPFDPNTHPSEKRVSRGGKDWCRDVWDSLIKTGEELELNRIVLKRSYVGAQPGQSCLVLPIFKCPYLPGFTTEHAVEKCCELRFETGDKNYKQVELSLECLNCEILIRANDVCVIVDL